MVAKVNSGISKTGLILHTDMHNDKSFRGEATFNYAYQQNPKVEPNFYTSYVQTTSGTWKQKHPLAIQVRNSVGDNITGYVNTGVTDWTNTYHGVWEYDEELRKPVVVMRDFDGQWKAKSWGTPYTLNSIGWADGDTFTLSWLQWTTHVGKSVNAGLYMRNSSNVWNFYAGLSQPQTTAFNTEARKWQRVYATFTVPTGMNRDHTFNVYMYGHYNSRNTVKVADVQLEKGGPSKYISGSGLSSGEGASGRSSTEVLVDLTGNHTINVINGFNYSADGQTFDFTGPTHLATVSGPLGSTKGHITMMAWVDQRSRNGPHQTVICTDQSYQEGMKLMSAYHGQGPALWIGGSSAGSNYLVTWGQTIENLGVHHIAATRNADDGRIKLYVNGLVVKNVLSGITGDIYTPTASEARIGIEYHSGGYGLNGVIHDTLVYNRVLSDAEVYQNFLATKGRYGL